MKLTLINFVIICLSILLIAFSVFACITNALWSFIAIGICACIIIGFKTGSIIEKIECSVAFASALSEIFTELEVDDETATRIMMKCMKNMEGDK